MNLEEIRAALPEHGGEIGYAELRLMGGDGRTISMLINPEALSLDDEGNLALTSTVKGATFATGADARVEGQRQNIQRMLEHLKFHCDELNPAVDFTKKCPHMESERT